MSEQRVSLAQAEQERLSAQALTNRQADAYKARLHTSALAPECCLVLIRTLVDTVRGRAA
jgi:hypothetical protein